MRVWDLDPGFLNDRSLLGEHRELHGIHAIIIDHKSGYSRHPETLRWVAHLAALRFRHGLLVEEMRLRGFNHRSPLPGDLVNPDWPPIFIDPPGRQFRLLKDKYLLKPQGRIPLPKNIQELWAAHKYSVMARDPAGSGLFGRQVASGEICFDDLAARLVLLLRAPLPSGRLTNAVLHMWGHVSDLSEINPQQSTNVKLLQEIQDRSRQANGGYLWRSTALAELKFWANQGS